MKREVKTILSLTPHLWPPGEPAIKARVVASAIFLVIAQLATLAVPLIYKQAVDALNGKTGPMISLPVGLVVGYGLMRIVSQAAGELRDSIFARVTQRAIRVVGLATFRHLHSLSLAFHLDRQTGGLNRAIERGISGIEFLLSFILFDLLPTLLEIILVCAVLWKLFNVWFAVATLGTIGSYIFFTLTFTEWRTKFRRQMNETETEANTKAIDSLLNFETVKYFGNEEHEAGRFGEALRRFETAAVKSKTTLSALNVGQGAIIALGLTLIMVMAGRGVMNKTMTVGDFVMVNTYLIQLYLPLNFLGFIYRQLKQSLIDMEQMFALLAVQPGIEDAPDARPLRLEGGHVAFESVHFGYHPRREILKGVSFTVPPGHTVALVGPSGAGKSTISRLLFRFYDVQSGAIRIDGQDLKDITQASLRAAIGIVPQDTVLFNDTIGYNIAYGRPGATQAEVEEAARLAAVHDFVVTLPDGYRTRVGERGLKLSGGEKQRVAIARTILKNPAILLFDEATSALDSHTERQIQESLRQVSRGRTTLVIAHRLSTIVEADEILVLEQGMIVERGRHSDLLARNGAYAALWRRQQREALLEQTLEEA